MYLICDEATGGVLSSGHPTVQEAEQELLRLLARLYCDVTATGDGCAGLVVDWTVRDAASGEVLVRRWGAPVPLPRLRP